MKTVTTLAVGFAMTIALAASAGDAKKELDKLRGTWKPVSYEIGGTKLEGEALSAVIAAITIKGDTFEWTQGDSTDKGTIKIDATKNPKHIDFVSELGGAVKVTSWSGIYAVDGKTLKFCVGPGAQARPMDFSGKSLTHGVFTLKQSK